MMEKRFIYNLAQGCYIANRGGHLIRIGEGSKGDTFMLFRYDEKFQKAFDEWKEHNKVDFD